MVDHRRTTSAAPPRTPIDILSRLTLPDPMPDGTNPFRVIDWVLLAVNAAAKQVMDARHDRIEELGRRMRKVQGPYGEGVPHPDDDVDWRAVDAALDDHIQRFHEAHKIARILCAEFGIPFAVHDPLLKTSWDELRKAQRVIRGVADCVTEYSFGLNFRLHDLANSTTRAGRPELVPPSQSGGPDPIAPPAEPPGPHTGAVEAQVGRADTISIGTTESEHSNEPIASPPDDQEQAVLVAMLDLQAMGHSSRRSASVIADRAKTLHPQHVSGRESKDIQPVLRRLKSREPKWIESVQQGQAGGYWLTQVGVQQAEGIRRIE